MIDKIIRAVLIFSAITVGIYMLSTVVLHFAPGISKGVSDMTRSFASSVYPSVKWESNYRPNQHKVSGPDIDVKVITDVKGKKYEGVGKLTSRTKVLLPFIFLIALIFATPISWKNKLIALGLGILVFIIYLMLLFSWTISYVEKVTAGADITKLWFGQVFNTNIGFMTILPIIIWLLVTLWAVDFNKFLPDDTAISS